MPPSAVRTQVPVSSDRSGYLYAPFQARLSMMLKLDRPARSVQEIEALPALGGPECTSHLQRKGTELSAETLVYLLREFAAMHKSKLFETCGSLLIGVPDDDGLYHGGKCEGIILNQARTFGFLRDPDLRTEYRGRCHERMWECISEGRSTKPFWEERFGAALRGICIDIGRALKAERARHAIRDLAEDGLDPSELRGNDDEHAWIAKMNAQELRMAIRELPEPLMSTAWMKWVEDFPITSPDDVSITSVLGISDSMVRRNIRAAKSVLALNPTVAALREDLS